MSAAAISDPTHDYRRDARKLRGRLADRPAELYRSLRRLSDSHDLQRNPQAVEPTPASPTSEFTTEVRDFLRNEMLTYSDRQNLLKSAEHRGIPRFEANLIIAAVQHRTPRYRAMVRVDRWSKSGVAVVCLLSQAALFLTIWALATR
jgi:hypothetical protein